MFANNLFPDIITEMRNKRIVEDDQELVETELAKFIERIHALEDQLERWKLASGLEGACGDPSEITPEQAQEYWEGLEVALARSEGELEAAAHERNAAEAEIQRLHTRVTTLKRAASLQIFSPAIQGAPMKKEPCEKPRNECHCGAALDLVQASQHEDGAVDATFRCSHCATTAFRSYTNDRH